MLRSILAKLPILSLVALALAIGSLTGATPAEAGAQCAYTLTTTVSGGGGFIGVSPGNSFACPDGLYHQGAYVTVIATPNPGYAWESWQGTSDNSVASTYVIMDGDQSIKATFVENCFSLTATVSGEGGFVSVSPGNSGGCPEGEYSPGTMVTVVATPHDGYQWESWTGTDDNSNRSTFVTMNSDKTVKATFSWNCYTLTTTVSGGGGYISVSPGNSFGCPEGQYSPGALVTVIATPNSGYVWKSWSGTDDNSSHSTFVTMSGNKTVKATFSSTSPGPTSTSQPTNTPPPAPTDTPQPTSTPSAPTATQPPADTPSPDDTPAPTPTLQPTATPTTSAPGPATGDVNCDGRTSSIDAALVLQYSAGLITTLPCFDQGDILDDDQVNSLDAAIILQITVRLL